MGTAQRVTSLTPWHVVFVLDDSGSMSGDPANSVNQALRAMIDEMGILSQGLKPYFKVSIIAFGSSARVVVEGKSEQNIDVNQIATFNGDSGGTNLTDGLRLAGDVLKRVPAKPSDFTPYIFLMTDGHADDPAGAEAAATKLKTTEGQAGHPHLVAIGMGDQHDGAFLTRLASKPELYKFVDDHKKLVKLFPAIGTIASTATGTAAVDQAIANI